jgi:pimeloyl-ACP methyl ester carboxylesterase
MGSLVVNPGGPSASGAAFVRNSSDAIDPEILDHFDLVSWDPRAINATDPVECGPGPPEAFGLDPGPDDLAEWDELDAVAADLAAACGRLDIDLLPHLHTEATVHDLEHLRRALGDEPLNYLGISYGTLIGQLHAQVYPGNVRAMVLDAVVDPALDLVGLARGQAIGLERVTDRMLASCEASTCPDGSPATAYDRVAARVEEEPLPADDADPVGPGELALATIVATYQPSLWDDLHLALAEADEGDGSGLRTLADRYAGFGDFGPYIAVLCVDLPHPADRAGFEDLADELADAAPRLGAAVATELLACAHWPVGARREPGEVRASSAPPVLVVGNTGDGATPFEQAEAVAAALDEAVLLRHEGEGHASLGDPCVNAAMAAYLVDLAMPDAGTTC